MINYSKTIWEYKGKKKSWSSLEVHNNVKPKLVDTSKMTYTLEDLGNCKTPIITNFDKVFFFINGWIGDIVTIKHILLTNNLGLGLMYSIMFTI